MGRKKQDPAALRTVGLFTKKTPLEEVEEVLLEDAPVERLGHPLDMVPSAEKTAVRWLGMDVFHEGDDVKIAEHPRNGAAVLVFVRVGPDKQPCSTATFKLSRAQYTKLKQLCRGEPDLPFP